MRTKLVFFLALIFFAVAIQQHAPGEKPWDLAIIILSVLIAAAIDDWRRVVEKQKSLKSMRESLAEDRAANIGKVRRLKRGEVCIGWIPGVDDFLKLTSWQAFSADILRAAPDDAWMREVVLDFEKFSALDSLMRWYGGALKGSSADDSGVREALLDELLAGLAAIDGFPEAQVDA